MSYNIKIGSKILLVEFKPVLFLVAFGGVKENMVQ